MKQKIIILILGLFISVNTYAEESTLIQTDASNVEGTSNKPDKSVLIQITVNRQGILENSEILKSSGDSDFDQKMLEFIRKVGQYPKTPANVLPNQEHIKIVIPIRSKS